MAFLPLLSSSTDFCFSYTFNLRVDWVYKGALLGTGPQVEPGFRGKLSCPLYNLTNRSHTITRKDEFATIDFERTTNFINELPQDVEPNLTRQNKLNVYVSGDRRLLLFDQKPLGPLEKYPKDYSIVSSLARMQEELAMWRKIGIGIVVSFIALTLTLLGLHNNLLRETISNAKDLTQIKDQLVDSQKDLAQVKGQFADSQRNLTQVKDDLANARKELQKLEHQTSKNPPK